MVEAELERFREGTAAGRVLRDLGEGEEPAGASPGMAPGSLEGGVALAVLERAPNPRRTLGRWREALAPGAPLFLWAPFLEPSRSDRSDLWRFTAPGLTELLEEAGFETLECHARGLTGLSVVLRHLYRSMLPPGERAEGARLAAYRALEVLSGLDRVVPLADWPVGTIWTGIRGESAP